MERVLNLEPIPHKYQNFSFPWYWSNSIVWFYLTVTSAYITQSLYRKYLSLLYAVQWPCNLCANDSLKKNGQYKIQRRWHYLLNVWCLGNNCIIIHYKFIVLFLKQLCNICCYNISMVVKPYAPMSLISTFYFVIHCSLKLGLYMLKPFLLKAHCLE